MYTDKNLRKIKEEKGITIASTILLVILTIVIIFLVVIGIFIIFNETQSSTDNLGLNNSQSLENIKKEYGTISLDNVTVEFKIPSDFYATYISKEDNLLQRQDFSNSNNKYSVYISLYKPSFRKESALEKVQKTLNDYSDEVEYKSSEIQTITISEHTFTFAFFEYKQNVDTFKNEKHWFYAVSDVYNGYMYEIQGLSQLEGYNDYEKIFNDVKDFMNINLKSPVMKKESKLSINATTVKIKLPDGFSSEKVSSNEFGAQENFSSSNGIDAYIGISNHNNVNYSNTEECIKLWLEDNSFQPNYRCSRLITEKVSDFTFTYAIWETLEDAENSYYNQLLATTMLPRRRLLYNRT